jgi:hypothetical protein
MFLEIDPEELWSADEILDRDPHLFQFRERKVFGAAQFPFHPDE